MQPLYLHLKCNYMSFTTICATIYAFTFFWLFCDYSMLQLLAFSYFHVDKFLNYIHPQISSYVHWSY